MGLHRQIYVLSANRVLFPRILIRSEPNLPLRTKNACDMEKYELRHDESRNRYTFDLDGQTAGIDYEKRGGTYILTHTFVPPAYEGRRIGTRLVAAVLADLRKRGAKVVPQCPFIDIYIRRHPVWHDLVADEI